MEKQKDPIGQRLKEKRNERGISVPELESILGIPKDRIYKWEKGTAPKYEDRIAIVKWIEMEDWKNFPRGKVGKSYGLSKETIKARYQGEQYLSAEGVNITLADYINLLHRENDRLYTLLNSSLVRISDDQQIVLAYHKAWVEFVAEKEAKGDKQKKKEIQAKMGRLVDGFLPPDETEGKAGR